MAKIEKTLLDLVQKLISDQKVRNIEEGLRELSNKIEDSEKDKDLKYLIDSILLKIIKENTIIKDSLFDFKEIICQTVVKILEGKEYDKILYFFYITENDDFTKIMLFSTFISNKITITVFDALFSILIEQNFDSLKNSLKKKNVVNIQNNKDFLYIINRYDLDELYNAADNSPSIDLQEFLKYDNEDIIKFIKKDETNNGKNISKNDDNNIIKINSNNQVNLETKNEENKIINTKDEVIKDDKIKFNDDKNNRIDKLISRSIKIECNKNLREKEFLDLNNQKINNNTMNLSDIIIDDFECKNENKLYLYSPISLIINNFKNKFEKNDFEIFNNDNYYIELFGNYLEEIIEKVNSFINCGNEEEYIKENKIKFGCYKNNHFYLCCKFNEKFKQDYFENKVINQKRYKKNENNGDSKIEIIKVKRKAKGDKEHIKQDKENNINKIEYKSEISSAKISTDNYINKISSNFEKEVNDFIYSEGCEYLQNILFFFNLKAPIKSENNIKFQSVRLSFAQSTENSLYGFREIDICLRNKKERTMESQILSNNICYVYNQGKFNHKTNDNIDVFLKKDSIIFCEVKNSFPNVSNGSEVYSKINVLGSLGSENSYQNLNYIDQLDNLIKKAKTFYYFFKDEKLIEANQYMHILYLYDFSDISFFEDEYDEIKNKIQNYIDNLSLPNDFKNIIIQIAYFNKEKNRMEKEQKLTEKIEKLQKSKQEKEDEIKAKEDEIKTKDDVIKAKDDVIKAKDAEIKKLRELLKNNKIKFE